jgi:hypothetical protein
MKKRLLILLMLMTALTCSYSQDTLRITSDQLKTTNLIFAEHEKLSKTVPLLEEQISNLKLINKSWEHTDSLRVVSLSQKDKSILALEKSLNVKKKTIRYGSIGSIILMLICLSL